MKEAGARIYIFLGLTLTGAISGGIGYCISRGNIYVAWFALALCSILPAYYVMHRSTDLKDAKSNVQLCLVGILAGTICGVIVFLFLWFNSFTIGDASLIASAIFILATSTFPYWFPWWVEHTFD